ncbi:hypothetical protein, partial [Streptomyces sp. KR55]|uniref:hypothetical protein n=1 Tax=Streptomyces sp. KR55 TaxID=3457425 RepID=UPI003FCF3422
MTFILEGRDRLSRVLDRAGDSAKAAEKKLAAFGAAIPAAAAIAPMTGAIGGATLAVAAFGLAVGGQISHLSEASQAQKKHKEAVEEYGAASEEAAKADLARHRTLAKMPPATREAAAALSVLKTEYREWSDDLADDTMPVVTKGIGIFNALLPKTSGLVKGASGELDRLMTIAGGAMNTPGFDRFMGKVEKFAVGSLRKAVDGVVHFAQVADTGKIGGGITEFLDFAREQGPVAADTLQNVALAGIHVLTAAGQTGVSLLQVANAAAKMVASIPTGFITTVLQLALAIKAVTLTRAGMLLVAGAFAAARTQILAASTAAAGASGAVGRLSAAFMALSTKARLAVAATGIGLVVLAVAKLSSIGKTAPPDVDRLTTSLGELARTGKVSGEAAKHFGKDLDGLYDSVRNITDPSLVDYAQNAIVKIFTLGQIDSTASKKAQENLDAIDDSLVSLVQGGKADLAAAALDRLAAGYSKNGKEQAKFRAEMDEYRDAVAAARLEEELAAQSMGLFGMQAQKTQQQLAAQKLSADGLRQSIQALSDTSRSAFDAQTRFEAALDNVTKSLKENGRTLDIGTDKGRANRDALSQLASATQEAAATARESGESWQTVNGIYDRGRKKLIESAQQMGLTRAQAKRLADQILRTPDKTARLKGNLEDLQAKLKTAKAELKRVPDSRRAKVLATIADLEAKIREARRQLNNLNGKTATTYVKTVTLSSGPYRGKEVPIATGGLFTGTGVKYRGKGYAGGGLVEGPGTGTSDSVYAPWLSAREFVVNAKQTAKHLPLLRAINDGKLAMGSLRGAGTAAAQGLAGGMTGSAAQVTAAARRMAAAVTAGVREELQISSPSKKMAALAKDIGAGLIKGLTG